jgi:DNA-binding PadR family transcriptional regulator
MARVNPTEFALLGLLAERSRSGYDIKQEVEARLSHFWSESFGHIYPMLRRLDERGLVEKTLDRQDGRPDRKVYSITDAGRETLVRWFDEPPAFPRPRNELLLRLFLGRHGPPEHLLRDVREFKKGVAGALDQLRAVASRIEHEGARNPDGIYWRLTLRYGVKAFAALAEWSDEAESALAELAEQERGGGSA